MERIYTNDCPRGVRILPMVMGNSTGQNSKRKKFVKIPVVLVDVETGEILDRSESLSEAARKAYVCENTLWSRIDRQIVKDGKVWRYAE